MRFKYSGKLLVRKVLKDFTIITALKVIKYPISFKFVRVVGNNSFFSITCNSRE